MQGGQSNAELARIEEEYRRNVTLVTIRPKMIRGGMVLWLLLDVVLILFFVLHVVVYLVAGSFREARDMATLGVNIGAAHGVNLVRAPEALVWSDVKVLERDTGVYDVYATGENENSDWYASVEYHFIDGDVVTPLATAVVLPGETHTLLTEAVAAARRPSGAELEVTSILWHRVDAHTIPDTNAFLLEHGNFLFTSSTYATDVSLEAETVGRAVFTVTNTTPYSYDNPAFLVSLKRAGTLVGLRRVTLSALLAGETREVEVHWFGRVPTSASVSVTPDINYFDASVFLPPEGDVLEDLRDRGEEE